mmetsp:Transcript_21845/g.49770  ORF Transcript_21845/g.49770 Transcript_21845/m.49770 type:complete len:231 (+) Transcript_21845:4126-4818(+)
MHLVVHQNPHCLIWKAADTSLQDLHPVTEHGRWQLIRLKLVVVRDQGSEWHKHVVLNDNKVHLARNLRIAHTAPHHGCNCLLALVPLCRTYTVILCVMQLELSDFQSEHTAQQRHNLSQGNGNVLAQGNRIVLPCISDSQEGVQALDNICTNINLHSRRLQQRYHRLLQHPDSFAPDLLPTSLLILHDTCKHTHAGIAQVFTWRRTQLANQPNEHRPALLRCPCNLHNQC